MMEHGKKLLLHNTTDRMPASCLYYIDTLVSEEEGLPVAMMEAMACGLPVICSDVRGNTDLVENGVSGIISESTPEKLAENILQLVSNPSKLQELSVQAAKTIHKFDLSAVEPEMLKIYGGVS